MYIELAKWLIPVIKAHASLDDKRMPTRHQYLLKLAMVPVLGQKLDYTAMQNEISYIRSGYDGR